MLHHFIDAVLPADSFRRHVALLTGASVVAQFIQLAATPILTRLYSPEAFGYWTLLMSVAGIGIAFGGWRYELAITLAADEREAQHVALAQFLCNCMTCGALGFVILVFGPLLAQWLNAATLDRWFMAVPVIVFFTVLAEAARFAFLRSRMFLALATYRILLATVTVGGALVVYPFYGGSVAGLIWGSIAGPASVMLVLVPFVLTRATRPAPIHWGEVVRVMVKYRKFPLYTVPYGLVTTTRERGIVFIMGWIATKAVVGYYGQVLRVLYIPVGLIATSINAVLLQRASDVRNRPTLEPLVSRLLTSLSIGIVPLFVFIACYSDDLFGLILGSHWRAAGPYATIMAAPAFTMVLANSVDRMLDMVHRQHVAFLLELIYSGLAVAGMVLGCLVWSDIFVGLRLLAVASCLGHVARIIAVYHYWRFSLRTLARLMGVVCFVAVITVCTFTTIARVLSGSFWMQLAVIASLFAAYYLLIGFPYAQRRFAPKKNNS